MPSWLPGRRAVRRHDRGGPEPVQAYSSLREVASLDVAPPAYGQEVDPFLHDTHSVPTPRWAPHHRDPVVPGISQRVGNHY